jgi:hypothetical protein
VLEQLLEAGGVGADVASDRPPEHAAAGERETAILTAEQAEDRSKYAAVCY